MGRLFDFAIICGVKFLPAFDANSRELLQMARTRFTSGRPRKPPPPLYSFPDTRLFVLLSPAMAVCEIHIALPVVRREIVLAGAEMVRYAPFLKRLLRRRKGVCN